MVWPALIAAGASLAGAAMSASAQGSAARKAQSQAEADRAFAKEQFYAPQVGRDGALYRGPGWAQYVMTPEARREYENSLLMQALMTKEGVRNAQRSQEFDGLRQRHIGGALDQASRNRASFQQDGGMSLADVMAILEMEASQEDPAAQELVNAQALQAIRSNDPSNMAQAAKGAHTSGLAATAGARARKPSLFQAMGIRQQLRDQGEGMQGIMGLLSAMQPGGMPNLPMPEDEGMKLMAMGNQASGVGAGLLGNAQRGEETAMAMRMGADQKMSGAAGGLGSLLKIFQNGQKIDGYGSRSIGETGWYGGPVSSAPSGYGDYTY